MRRLLEEDVCLRDPLLLPSTGSDEEPCGLELDDPLLLVVCCPLDPEPKN